MTTAIQLWSEYQTAIVVAAVLLLTVVGWLAWSRSRKQRHQTEAKLVEEAQPGKAATRQTVSLRKVRAEESAADTGTPDQHAGISASRRDPASGARSATPPPPPLLPFCQGDAAEQNRIRPADDTPPDEGMTAAAVQLALDSESGPVGVPAPVVECLPEIATRPTRATPRTPRVAVGSSIGAYRMVRPSEPEVLTPPPSMTPPPGTLPVGQQTPGPRRSLSLSAKMRRSEVGSNRSPVPATSSQGAPVDSSSPPDVPCPALRNEAGDTIQSTPDKPPK